MKSYRFLIFLIAVSFGLTAMGDNPSADIRFLIPSGVTDTSSSEPGYIVLVSAAKSEGSGLTASSQWELTRQIDLNTKTDRESFIKDFYRIFSPGMTIEKIQYAFRFFKSTGVPDSLQFRYSDSVSIQKLWQMPAFAAFIKAVQSTDGTQMLMNIRGWKDSVYTGIYDDPSQADRTLYKINLHLIPGWNNLYFAPDGRKERAVGLRRLFQAGSSSNDSSARFHGSVIQAQCTSCHENLPGTTQNDSLKADCSVCHKALGSAAFTHAPVEMKECTSCHRWSAGDHTMTRQKDVPELCYDCHIEKKATVDSSAHAHPVAGDCLTCHSPHGTDQPHLLKQDVFTLCTGCHKEYMINHPVGRHPLRFARIGDSNNEISCVSCHQPHGSANDNLLVTEGGSMSVCLLCHKK